MVYEISWLSLWLLMDRIEKTEALVLSYVGSSFLTSLVLFYL